VQVLKMHDLARVGIGRFRFLPRNRQNGHKEKDTEYDSIQAGLQSSVSS
jgi:hypothetical protein